ncbi:NAC domain-containing protein 1-like [Solanum stenotomum]|uniref:NAC domain-containing protein 1-like n=1 Tax=Solanum stenotomum TaxID=172797 RepID=UPI0020D017F0|nr:NAC domain-containing protein 1-like [Solanum stenotomum]
MENHNTSPTNNVSKDNLISANHINELPISAVFSNKNSNGDQIMSTEDVEALMKRFPPGFRFYPTDYELIKYYLERKLANLPLQPNKIYEMNIYKYDPDTIAAYLKPTTAENVWYVFTPRDRKYPNGERPDRCTGNGYWKATGADISINDDKNSKIGSRRALVYHIGKPPKGKKTDWIMHEYMIPKIPIPNSSTPRNPKLDEWVLCRFYNKNDVITTRSTRRKRKRENDDPFIDEVHEDSTGNNLFNNNDNHAIMLLEGTATGNNPTNYFNNNNNQASMFFQSTDQDSMRNDLTNFKNNYNHAMSLHPQVHTGLSTLPQYSYMSILSNYQNNVSDHYNNYTDGTPLPLMIEPTATNNSIEHDYTMNNEGFGSDYGEYPEQDQYYAFDQYIVSNYELQYNTNNFVNCETTTSNNFVNGETTTSNNFVNCETTTSNNFVNGETITSDNCETNTSNKFVNGETSTSKEDC